MLADVSLRGQLRFHDGVALRNAMMRLQTSEAEIFESGFVRFGLLVNVDWSGEAVSEEFEGLKVVLEGMAGHALSGAVRWRSGGHEGVVEAGGARRQLLLDKPGEGSVATDDVERVAFALKGEGSYTLRAVSRRGEVIGGLIFEAWQRGLLSLDELAPHLSTVAMSPVGLPSEAVEALIEHIPSAELAGALDLLGALARRPDASAVGVFGRLLGDRRAKIREAAVAGLVTLGEVEVGAVVEAALGERGVRRRQGAVEVLAALPGSPWVEARLKAQLTTERHKGLRARLEEILLDPRFG